MGQLGPKMGQNEVLCHFLGGNALNFADSAYNDRYFLYLVGDGVPGAEKKFDGPKMGQLGPKMGQNEVIWHFLCENALIFADCAYYERCF